MSVLSKSIIKVGSVGFGNIFNAALGFAFLAAVARTLELHTFGQYALITTLLVSVTKLIDFGTNSVFVAKSIASDKDDETFNNVFLTTKIILTIATFPIFIAALAFLHEINLTILSILFLGSIAYAINYTLFGYFQRDEKYFQLIALNMLPAIIKGIFAGLIFFSFYKPDLSQASAIFSLSIFASALLIPFLPKKLHKFTFQLGEVKKLLKNAYPAGVSQLITEFWPTIGNSVAKVFGNFTNVGIFSLASKISHMFALVSLSIFTVLLPKNANRKKKNLDFDFKETIVISSIILIIAVLITPFSHIFIDKFFGSKFQDSLAILNILIFSAALTSIHTFVENYFFVEQKTDSIMHVNVGKLIVFISFCLFLFPFYSLKGMAVADLISSLSAVGFTIYLIRKSRL